MKYDEGKPKLTLCPTEIITAVAMVREYGAKRLEAGNPGKTFFAVRGRRLYP